MNIHKYHAKCRYDEKNIILYSGEDALITRLNSACLICIFETCHSVCLHHSEAFYKKARVAKCLQLPCDPC